MVTEQKYIYKPASLKKLTYNFSLSVINLVKEMPEDKVIVSITDQLIKSSTSIGANIIEAYSSSSSKESKKYFEIAFKSNQKSEYWLTLLRESYGNKSIDLSEIISDCQTIRAMLEMILDSMENEPKLYD